MTTTTTLGHPRLVDPTTLHDSPTNPRGPFSKSWDLSDLTEQGADVVARLGGLARPHPTKKGELELVYGHRRKHAAIALGVKEFAIRVVELSDRQVLTEQQAENRARRNIHPLLEAEHLQRMVDEGLTQEEIAVASGETVGWVQRHLSLLKLTKKCGSAYRKGKFEIGVALILARIPVPKLQNKAMDELLASWRYRNDGTTPTTRAARDMVKRRYTLDLAEAHFDTSDEDLVKGVGSCSACPKRTVNQGALFDDLEKGDLCTDPTCHAKKSDAGWAKLKAEAAAKGEKVLEGKAASGKVGYGGSLVSLEHEEWTGKGSKKVRNFFKKKSSDLPPITLVRTEHGKVMRCIARADFNKVTGKKSSSGTGSALGAQRKRERERKALEKAVRRATTAELVARVERLKTATKKVNLAFIGLLVSSCWHDGTKEIAQRRGLKFGSGVHGDGPGEALRKHAAKLGPDELRGLAWELALAGRGFGDQRRADAAKALGVNTKKIRASVTKEQQATKKKKKKARTKAKAK